MIRRFVIFSGFDTDFIEQVRHRLNSKQIDVIFRKRQNVITEGYFLKLLDRLNYYIMNNLGDDFDECIGLVASCINEPTELNYEKDAFFPALRRIAFPSKFRNDFHRLKDVESTLIRCFTSKEIMIVKRFVRSPRCAVLALPILNTRSRRFRVELESLYNMESMEPKRNIYKEIRRSQRGRALRVRDIDFSGRLNDNRHPIRRCADTVICDIRARLRLGLGVSARFEFDVTCEHGLGGREFLLCDGRPEKIPAWATHLNMRINDDFKCGQTS